MSIPDGLTLRDAHGKHAVVARQPVHYIHTMYYLPEDCIMTVQMRLRGVRDKPLRAACIRAV